MRLSTYLAQKRLTVAEMARALNVPHATALHWCRGRRTPRPARIAQIQRWTDGQVTAADWLPDATGRPAPANGVRQADAGGGSDPDRVHNPTEAGSTPAPATITEDAA